MKRLATQYILAGLISISLFFAPLKVWSYVDTFHRDFNADAPWRVQNAHTQIPFSFLIKDVWKDGLTSQYFLHRLVITTYSYGGAPARTIYDHDFGVLGLKIDEHTEGVINGNWEWNINTFENADDRQLDGLPITASNLGHSSGQNIFFVASMVGSAVEVTVSGPKIYPHLFSKYLKIHVGESLPKPGPDWYYGDTHFHTEYTNDLKEYGGQLTAVKDAASAMGLDFITTTDHASDLGYGPLGWFGWFGWFSCGDLCQASWIDLRDRINELNDSNELPFIQGEEITCQAVSGRVGNGIHLLIYNNEKFIAGSIGEFSEAYESLESKLDELKSDGPGFAYAAHPVDDFPIGSPWSVENYRTALDRSVFAGSVFAGLEIWNGRKTKKSCPDLLWDLCPNLILDFYVNPFDDNGEWPNKVDNWDAKLIEGIEKWDELLRANLDPLTKIFISGGSDAHGDMNYVVGGLGELIDLNDNAMGKVRTLVYASGGKNRENILNGLKNGRSVVTDGPVGIFGMDRDQNGRLEGNGSDVIIGDHIVLPQTDSTTFFIQWNSTEEFGDINEIAIFRGDRLQTWELAKLYPFNGREGSLTWSQNATMVPGTYYYRVEARIRDNNGNIVYRGYTNPIWITYSCLTTVSQYHWKGEYFDNKDLSGTPLMVRDDGTGFLDFDWGLGSPGSSCGVGADQFSVRWTRTVYFSAGTYRFTITSDDGFRIYIDGTLKLEKWFDQGPTTYTVDVPLTAGDHQIVFAYYENGGYATAKLSWEETANCLANVPAENWKGEYFDNKDMSGSPLMVKDDGTGFLDFDWAYGSPGSTCGLDADSFSARWTRSVYFSADTYRFTITSDDGFRFYIDGTSKLEKWFDQGPTTYTVDVPLTAGDHKIAFVYYENGGYATAKLSWEETANCLANVSAENWKGEYFDNKDMSGSPLMVRDDGTGFLDFDWGLGSPGSSCGVGADQFSIRWIRTVYFNAGTYRFTITSDDGFRLFVDGVSKLEKWFDQGPTTYTVDVSLTAGDHKIAFVYYENGGYATAKLSWEETANCLANVSAENWKGEYFDNKDMSGSPLMVRDDGTGFLDFDWAYGGPGSACGIGADYFSARWTRHVYFSADTYRFTITSDDGFRLYIDGTLKLEKWFDQGATTYTVDVPLTAGDHQIVFAYYENGGYAVAKLSWAKASPSGSWAYPVGDPDSGAGWQVTNPLGNSWYSEQNQRWYRGHLGEDWFKNSGSSLGEPVYAASAGEVITVLQNCGNYVDVVIIEHQVEGFDEPIYSFYGHIEADGYVQEGDWVEKRQQIGRLGDPVTFEPHLHFEIKNRTALINIPFSSCSNIPKGIYISAGYSDISGDYDGGDYYDPSNDGVQGNRYYHPTRFIENHKDGGLPPEGDCSEFVADLNYPDGTVVLPGQSINKGWRLSNCGDTTWSSAAGYRAVRISGSYGPTSFNIPTVGPGQTGDLYANITVPTTAGTHRATYKLEGSGGTFGEPFWVEVVVEQEAVTDCSKFVADLNYPDGTVVLPGQSINKGWRLSNCGDTTWSSAAGYRAVRISGSYGPTSFNIPTVGPGQTGDLYANITVPTTAGTHRATYKLEGSGGTFGEPFWVEVEVKQGAAEYIVDDGDTGFVRFGPSQYWHKESIGYGGDMYWTYVNGNVVSNKAQWRPQMSGAGNYQVKVFIPNNYATTGSAKYTIKANGSTYTAIVNQNNYYDQWVTLGTYSFNASNNGSEYVELTDATGESGSSYKKIGFDAVKWAKQ